VFNVGIISSSKPLWTPSQLDIEMWYNDESSITTSTGLSQWNDISGNNYHLTQGTGSQQPTVNPTGLDGKRTIEFDGTNGGLFAPSGADGIMRNTTYGWASAVFTCPEDVTPTDRPIVWFSRGTSTASRFVLSAASTTLVIGNNIPQVGGRKLDSDAFGATNAGAIEYADAWGFMVGRINYDTRLCGLYLNGTQRGGGSPAWSTAQTTTSDTDSEGVTIGRFLSGAAYFKGGIAEIVVGNTPLSDEDMYKMDGYLAHKWGLESLLPVDHPYKNSAPRV
jgi:hypothetical protein